MIPEQAEIDRYLERLGEQLRGSPRYRREILTEIRSHLAEIVEGADCSSADATCRFGDADQIARELNRVREAKRQRDFRRMMTGAAAAATAVLAAVSLPNHGEPNQASAPPVSALRQPLAVALDPMTGRILSETPISAHGRR